jgi:hypothetical protein
MTPEQLSLVDDHIRIGLAMIPDSPYVAALVALRAEYERLRAERDKYQNYANESAHVIVEAGVVPGVDYSCRCEQCRSIAQRMDEAGYLDRITDRWWKSAAAAKEE